MAELSTLARPYSRAAFEYADKAGQLAGWSTALNALSAVMSNDNVAQALNNPLSTADKNADLIVGLLGDELDDKQRHFVTNLAANKRLSLAPEIASLYDVMKANRERAIDVEVTSAFAVSEDQQTQLSDALSKRLDRVVSLTTKVDQSLIGGALIQAGDTRIDGTVKGQLAKLAEAMNS